MPPTTTRSSFPVNRAIADGVMAALQEQVGCYRRLAKLAELQHSHVQQSNTEGLLEVLQSRQRVLEEIARLETTVAAAKRDWNAFTASLPSDKSALAESLVAETRRLLEQITSSDRTDVLVLQQRMLNVGKQITQAGNARQVNRQYSAAAYGPTASRMDLHR